MNRIELLRSTEKKLMTISSSYQAEAKTLVCHVLSCQPIDLIIEGRQQVDADKIQVLESLIQKRLERVPLQYLLGVQAFYGLDFEVNEQVLIPRPETEVLVSAIIKWAGARSSSTEQGRKSLKILDIGVGSGAIVVALAKSLPDVIFSGSDISKTALHVARTNALRHGVDHRITWYHSDLFNEIPRELYDIIVSNPPYIPLSDKETLEPEVRLNEPSQALFGGEDGLDLYRRMIPEAQVYLAEGGILVFEAGHDQWEAIESLLIRNDYTEVGHFEDLNGIPRFIYGRKALTGGQRNHV